MKKLSRKLAAGFLALAMVLTTALPYLPSIDVFAASKTMAHIVSGAENGNGHFGSATPEAFALSPDATFTNEDFSSTLKLGSAQSDTRARVVLKYKDDSNWAYIGYDGAGSATDWIYEYNNNGTSSYGSVAGLPAINQNDMFTVSVSYTDSAVNVTVRNTTAGTSGTASVTNASFVALKDVAGKVGFGGATNSSYTDLYFSGVASAATDGDSSTYWHSNWSTTGFNVSESNPAILTVDLGKSMDIGGFKFQQRPSTNNGIVYQYSYRILDENDQVIESGDHITVPSNLRAGAAWVSTQFDTTAKNARKIQILVEEGQGGFAAISEVVPFTVQKVADAVTLDAENVTLKVGETVTLTPSATPEGAMLKGLVWSSSDEEIATVDENGVVTALKEGTATIKVSNVAGLEATCKVTVKGKAEQPDVDKEAPTAPGKLSKAEVTKDSIQIRWKKSKDNVGVEGYEIFLNGVSIKKVSADTTSVMISNLLAGTEYQITVKAYDAAGNYSEAAALTVKTLAEDKNNSGNKDDNQKPDSGNKNDGQKPSGDQNQNSSADKKPAGVPQVTVVKTGDSGAPIGIFVVLAIVAAGAVVVVVLRMKADQKKNAKKKHRNRPDGTR